MRPWVLASALVLLAGLGGCASPCRPLEMPASEADARELRQAQTLIREDLAKMRQWAEDRSRTDDLRIQSLWTILDNLQRSHGLTPEPLPNGGPDAR